MGATLDGENDGEDVEGREEKEGEDEGREEKEGEDEGREEKEGEDEGREVAAGRAVVGAAREEKAGELVAGSRWCSTRGAERGEPR